MTTQLFTPIIHLEPNDVDKGVIRGHRGPGVVLIQGNFCGYCTAMKPHYQALAEMYPDIRFMTVQVDGPNPEFGDGKLVQQLVQDDVNGIPYVRKFHNGRPVGAPYRGDPKHRDELHAWLQN